MKNLKVVSSSSSNILAPSQAQCPITINNERNTSYICIKNEIIGFDCKSGEVSYKYSLSENGFENAVVNKMEHLLGEDSICLSTKSGDLILLSLNNTFEQVECVGSVESGIHDMSWSPDQELLTIATGHGTIILMTREFDPVQESPLIQDRFGEGEFVNVGWGKKETQFHGSKGKKAALQKQEIGLIVTDSDDGLCRLSWRDDGKYFTASYIDREKSCRRFRIWNRECVLQYTSEVVSGIEASFAWKSSVLMTTTQRKPHRHDVVFFETNGLQHGEFTLPFKQDQVVIKSLQWNNDSTVLLIWSEEKNLKNQTSYLQLWTSSNYHWYLKQHLQFTSDEMVNNVKWDLDANLILHVFLCNGDYRAFKFITTVNDSVNLSLENTGDFDNQSIVASISGKYVNMTPFAKLSIPPPLCAYRLCFPTFVNSVVFCQQPRLQNDAMIIMQDGRIAIFQLSDELTNESESDGFSVELQAAGGNGFKKQCRVHEFKTVLNIEDKGERIFHLSMLRNHVWINENLVASVGPSVVYNEDILYLFEIKYNENKLIIRDFVDISSTVTTMNCHENHLIVQLDSGAIKKFSLDTMNASNFTDVLTNIPLALPRKCEQLQMCSFRKEECVLARTEHSQLYLNTVEIATGCSSFCVHNDFVFFTTSAHKLQCINRKADLKNVIQYYTANIASRDDLIVPNGIVIETVRSLERGSRIVTVTPQDTRLVLQMPRGNLEIIHPRCLIISLITSLIESGKYLRAFTIMRKHRINMNLFYDINPKSFLENTEIFVNDLASTQFLNLFLSDLKNEDYTIEMYKQYYNTGPSSKELNADLDISKIDLICNAVIQVMEKDEKRFILSLVTAHVKKSTMEVGTALRRLKKYITSDKNLVVVSLQLLTVLVDANVLFSEALGTYDFELVVLVAEKSQKDPKEYLPMLQELLKLPEDYRKYKIDVNLRKYESALSHIANCDGKFDECMEFISRQKLFKTALHLYKKSNEKFCIVAKSYAEHLANLKKYNEAGVMYLKCGKLKEAMEAFKTSGNHNMCLSIAHRLKITDNDAVELSSNLATTLQNQGKKSSAVLLLGNEANNVESSIELAFESHMWNEGIYHATKHNRIDLIETHLKPALIEAATNTSQLLTEYRTKFHKYSMRIEAARKEKEKQKLQAILDGDDGRGMTSDLYSDTSSVTGSVSSFASSSYSKSTGRSSKSRKKSERRRYSLKEGSKFEELALLQELHKIVKSVFDMEDEIMDLLLQLSSFDYFDQGSGVSILYSVIRKEIRISIDKIWNETSVHNMLSSSNLIQTGPQSTVNSILSSTNNTQINAGDVPKNPNFFQDLQLMIPPTITKNDNWKIDVFI